MPVMCPPFGGVRRNDCLRCSFGADSFGSDDADSAAETAAAAAAAAHFAAC